MLPEQFIEMSKLQSERYQTFLTKGGTPSEFFQSPLEILTLSLLWDAIEVFLKPKHTAS